MKRKMFRPTWRVTDHLHPSLYLALAALALLFVISAWSFGGMGETDYLLTVVTGLVSIAVLLPTALWRIWRNHSRETGEPQESFREWAASDFHTWQDHVSGIDAAVEILLPVAAVAFDMLIFAIIIHFTAG